MANRGATKVHIPKSLVVKVHMSNSVLGSPTFLLCPPTYPTLLGSHHFSTTSQKRKMQLFTFHQFQSRHYSGVIFGSAETRFLMLAIFGTIFFCHSFSITEMWWIVKFSHPMKCQNFRDSSGLNCNPCLILCPIGPAVFGSEVSSFVITIPLEMFVSISKLA